MPVPIHMPDFGTAVSEVRIAKWLVEEGAAISRGTILVEIETDKAVMELESVAAGTLLKRCIEEGATAEPGDVIAYIGAPGEAIAADAPGEKGVELTTEPPLAPVPRPRVAPIVANLAAKLGVDLASIEGSGEGGIITREDVIRASREIARPPRSPAGEKLSRMQAAVARAVAKSNAEIPHLRMAMSIDMTAVDTIRQQRRLAASKGYYEAVMLKAMAQAIAAVPLVASRLEEQFVRGPSGFHISLAVGFGNELLLPVVRDVDQKDIGMLRSEVEDLVARARTGSLKLEELTGGCMTLSNLGMYPVDWFEAIVFPGQSGILALGAISDRPIVVNGRVEARRMATATLAADHRLINGRVAAEYLTKLKEILEAGAFV